MSFSSVPFILISISSRPARRWHSQMFLICIKTHFCADFLPQVLGLLPVCPLMLPMTLLLSETSRRNRCLRSRVNVTLQYNHTVLTMQHPICYIFLMPGLLKGSKGEVWNWRQDGVAFWRGKPICHVWSVVWVNWISSLNYVQMSGSHHRNPRLRESVCSSGVWRAEDPEPERQGQAGWGQRESLPEGILWRSESMLWILMQKSPSSTQVSKNQALWKVILV